MCVDCISKFQNKLPLNLETCNDCSLPAFAPGREGRREGRRGRWRGDCGTYCVGGIKRAPAFPEDFDYYPEAFGCQQAPAFRPTRRIFIPPPVRSTTFIPPFVKTPAYRGTFGLETPMSAFGDTVFERSRIGGQIGNISVVSYPAITEEDGGTSGQTAKLESISAMPVYKYERFESCVAIAGEGYCVIAADYTRDHTKISQPTEKSVMASSGFHDLKALQDVLFFENLLYECQHKKPMSCLEINRLLSKVLCEDSKGLPFTVLLGGIDSQGKGCIYTYSIGCHKGVGYNFQDELNVPPILKYRLPAKDVLARVSETEAVDLAKNIFESTTHTGDKLEIVVINASGLRHHEYMDLTSPMDISY